MSDRFRPSDDTRRTLLQDAESDVSRTVKSVWSGFLDFALRDNVLEVAAGLMWVESYLEWQHSVIAYIALRIAGAFTAVVNSLVSDILLPPISLLPFMSRNLEEKFLVLRKGAHYKDSGGYNTRNQAVEDGAVILTYGYVRRSISHSHHNEASSQCISWPCRQFHWHWRDPLLFGKSLRLRQPRLNH